MWTWFKFKIAFSLSLKALKKLAVEKIGGEKKWIFKIFIIIT
jgi:hypothetical protein